MDFMSAFRPGLVNRSGEIHLVDHFISDTGVEAFSLFPEIFHHFRAHATIRITGVIFHVIGGNHAGHPAGAQCIAPGRDRRVQRRLQRYIRLDRNR
jgi:hypothetical protein